MPHYTLTVYQNDDTTVLFEVGTDPGHARPWLKVPTEFGESEVDLLNGQARIGQYNLEIIDPQTGAAQEIRGLTALLSGSSGNSQVNWRRGVFKRVSPDVAVIQDGVIYGSKLNESFASYTFYLRDTRERGRKVTMFSRTGTSTIFPRGVLNGYGRLKAPTNGYGAGWLIAPTTPEKVNTIIDGTRTIFMPTLWGPGVSNPVIQPHQVLTSTMIEVSRVAARSVGGQTKLYFPNIRIGWRVNSASPWNWLDNIESHNESSPGAEKAELFGQTGSARVKNADGTFTDVKGVHTIWAGFTTDGQARPANGAVVELVVVYIGPATESYPFHYEGTAGELLKKALDGEFSSDETGVPVNPRIRYDEDSLIGAGAHNAMRRAVRFRQEEVEEDLREWIEDVSKQLRVAPALDALGRIVIVSSSLPDPSVPLPEINNGNARAMAGWEHPAGGAITQVDITYPRDYKVPPDQDPTGTRSAGDGIASVEQKLSVKPKDPTVQQVVGIKPLKIDGFLFRALGTADGRPLSGDVMDETGALIAVGAGYETIDRWAFGGQTGFRAVSRSDAAMAALKVGDWVIDAVSWAPNYATGQRGRNNLSQIVSIRELDSAWRGLRLIDAAPHDNPIGQPTLGAISVNSEGVLSVPVLTVPAGGEARVEFAISNTLPSAGSGLWTFLGRTAVAATLLSPPNPAGAILWVRSRGEKVGRRPSAWTNAVTVTASTTPRVLDWRINIDDGGVVVVSGYTNSYTNAVRVRYSIRAVGLAPFVSPPYVDAQVVGGAFSVTLPTPVRAGEEVTVEVEPWSGWSGSAATGTAGEPLSLVSSRTDDGTAGTLLGFRKKTFNPNQVTYGWEWGPGVVAIKVQKALVAQPVTVDSWPDPLTIGGEIITDTTVTSYTFDVPRPGYSQLAQFIPILGDGSMGPMYERAEIQATGTAPDVITSLVPFIIDETGEVTIRIEVAERTGSVRYAFTVGTNPAWPTNAAVEAGLIATPVGGVVEIPLPAGTVGYNQMIRVKAAPYVDTNGTGLDGVTDHGEFVSREDVRFKPPVSLEITTETKTSTQGIFGVTVRDPGGYGTGGLYVRTKTGEAAPTAWALVTATPVNGTEYQQSVALIEGHPSQVQFRLGYSINGSAGFVFAESGGFDFGAYPNITIVPRINEDTAQASAAIIGDADTFSVKVAASTSGYPSAATVRAQSAISGRMLTPAMVGTLATPTLGQMVYFSAFGYGPNGEESTALAKAEAQFKIIAPLLVVASEGETATTGSFGVTVVDPAGQADSLWYRTKSGDAPWGPWILKSGAPADGSTHTETVTLVEDHPSYIEFRLDFVLAGDAQSFHLKSSGFDKGKVPDTSVTLDIDANGNVTANLQGDFDTGSHRISVSTAGYPDLATTRVAGIVTGRSNQTTTLATLNVGDTAYASVLGYTDAAGGGTESTSLQRAKITRMAFIAPKVTEELSRSGTTTNLGVTISDPLKRTTLVEWKESVQGGAYGGFSTSWNSATGTPGVDVTITRGLSRTLTDGKDIMVTYRVTFTDENGASKTISNTVSMSNLTGLGKTMRVGAHAFMPHNNTVQYHAESWYVAGPQNVTTAKFHATIVVPFGVTITKFTARGYHVGSDTSNAYLYRGDGSGSGSAIASVSLPGSTGQVSATLSEAVNTGTSNLYTMTFENTKSGSSGLDSPLFYWAEIEYSVPDYSKTL